MFQKSQKPGSLSLQGDLKMDNQQKMPGLDPLKMLEEQKQAIEKGSQPLQMLLKEEEEKTTQKKEEEKELQAKKENNEVVSQTTKSGTKAKLPDEVQTKMEGAFGTSFADVNIHKDDNSATDMGALAYTQGKDVHFAPGQYNPGTQKGQELIGHELTHVEQQKAGRVQPTKQGKGMAVNDSPALEHEADVMGKKAAEGKSGGVEEKSSRGQVSEKKQENLQDLHNKLNYLSNSALYLGQIVFRKLVAWEMYAREVGCVYASAMEEFTGVVESKEEYSENLDSICSAVLSGVAAGLLGYVANLAKTTKSITKLSADVKRIAESGIDSARFAAYNTGKEIEGQYKSQTKVNGKIPLVYQNLLINKITNNHLLLLKNIDSVQRTLLESQASLFENLSISEKQNCLDKALYAVGALENLVNNSLKPVKEVPNELNYEFQRGFFKNWMPNLKKVVTKYTEQHDLKHPVYEYTEEQYDTSLGKTMINHFLKLGIIRQGFGRWTSQKDIKSLLNWAATYEIKNMV